MHNEGNPEFLIDQGMYYPTASNEGNSEFVSDQGMYYPTASNYGYYCTGFESPGEWEDHSRGSVGGAELDYTGVEGENMLYLYYPDGYGYVQSPYNPYNPYIPGAVLGIDNTFLGAEPYCAIPSHQNLVSSPAYFPITVEPDIIPDASQRNLYDTSRAVVDGCIGLKHSITSSASSAFPMFSTKLDSNYLNSNVGITKQPVSRGRVSATGFPPVTSNVLQNRNASGSIQTNGTISKGKFSNSNNQVKVGSHASNVLPGFGITTHGRASVDKVPNIRGGRSLNGVSVESCGEQNRLSRTNKSKSQLTANCNMDTFPVHYTDAKFFVIKSYSEDDVHKSIKYNVWSSTPNGNRKLQNAYEESLKLASVKASGCPIFLFFSVNASGQFCGVTEMIGQVDFLKDMNFWQQDKWNGSFPVKWHMIKDVSNMNLRHIILENNENKPVTNSRDTQEIPYKQGLEMLKIFKNNMAKTSIVDDFVYYENRQKIMQDEKERYFGKGFGQPFIASASYPAQKQSYVELSALEDVKITTHGGSYSFNKNGVSDKKRVSATTDFIGAKEGSSLSVGTKRDLPYALNKDVAFDKTRVSATPDSSITMKEDSPQHVVATKTDITSTSNKKAFDKKPVVEMNGLSTTKEESIQQTVGAKMDVSSAANNSVALDKKQASATLKPITDKENREQRTVGAKNDVTSTLKIGSLTINPKQSRCKPFNEGTELQSTEHVDASSAPLKLNGLSKSSGYLTVGSISLDTRAMQVEKGNNVLAKTKP